MFSSVVASAAEVPTGFLFTDLTLGDIEIGSSSVSPFSLDPPGSSDFGYNVVTSMAYNQTSSSGTASGENSASVSADSDGYFNFSGMTNVNTYYHTLAFRYLAADGNASIAFSTPCWIWVDFYISNSSGVPVSQSVIDSISIGWSRSLNSSSTKSYSLASTSNLSYDSSTGHLFGYVDVSDGIGGSNISGYPFFILLDSSYPLGTYSWRISNVFFGKDKSLFTPPGSGSGGVDPVPPSFEEQVLQDLDNIQNNQQTQTEQISGAIQNQTDTLLSEDENTGLIGKLVKKIKELFIPNAEFFSDFWNRLNQFFADRFGFLWFPIEHFIECIGRLMALEDTQPTISIPELAFDDHVLIPAQTYTFDFLASEPWSTIHGYYLLAIDAALIMAFVSLLGDKLKEVMNR